MSTLDMPDWTFPVDIIAQSIGNLAVDIAAQTIEEVLIKVVSSTIQMPTDVQGSTIQMPADIQGSTIQVPVDIQGQYITLDVNIAGSSVTLNVSITESTVTLNVNIESISSGVVFNVAQSGDWTINAVQSGTWTINIGAPLDASGNLKTAVVSSVQLDVNIAAQTTTLNVNIESQTAALNVQLTGSEITLDVNIASQTAALNVNITGSEITLDVNIASQTATLNVNIESQTATLNVAVTGTANVNVTDAMINISSLKLMDSGTIKRVAGYASGAYVTLYTVPAGKKFYIFSAMLNVRHYAAGTHEGAIYIWDGVNYYPLIFLEGPDEVEQMNEMASFTMTSIPEGWEIIVFGGSESTSYAAILGVEVDA